jgi:nitroreductase
MMTEALNCLERRRSIRSYLPDQITDKELNAVLRAGTYAPTGGGTQSPVMVAVQDPALRDLLSSLNARVMGAAIDPFYGAPTVIVVLGDKRGQTWLEDGCLVMGNLLNAAYAVGLGSCWVHRAREVFATDEGRRLLTEWGLDPERYVGIGHCVLGYANCEAQRPAPRKKGYTIRR